MSEEQLLAARIEAWATAGVAAMLARVRNVCIIEYGWMIEELQKAIPSTGAPSAKRCSK